ncbi:cytochrome c [Comamonas aquatica]|uniref:Cytochrome c n=1 Tax=Comamonas aquatica TaxID=225991 RepID=A0AA42W3N6_9BURK|nr:cytochrome c [Comamonas aquatica]MDH1429717.1 cytochrome c [Comamonas aquatica]MDH1605317.1 cytochrome c [Comamonas aquatica]MDH1616934.1 cytochrome c [Comamonas aquatica]MDH2005356.1 cytochrome c [Comamonas aquatica]
MHSKKFSRGLVVAGLLLASLSSMAAHAGPATGSAKEVMAIADSDVVSLKDNFSDSRQINTQRGGKAIYEAICQGCHMPKGQGAQGAGFYPPLANNSKLAAAAYPVGVVMNGLHGMPSFAPRLNDEQVAEVVNYVRTHFGNQFTDTVKAEDVKLFRK